MLEYRLSELELAELRAAHRRALNVREACRINASRRPAMAAHP